MPNREPQYFIRFQIITRANVGIGDKIPSSLGNQIPFIGITVPQKDVRRISV